MKQRHQNLPNGAGFIYLGENISRALAHLVSGKGTNRERIINACLDTHRSADNEFFTGYLSDESLEHWRNSRIGRYDKRVDELTDDEINELSTALTAYITNASRDAGICEAGGDPKEYEPYSDHPELSPPFRNVIADE